MGIAPRTMFARLQWFTVIPLNIPILAVLVILALGMGQMVAQIISKSCVDFVLEMVVGYLQLVEYLKRKMLSVLDDV